MANTKLALELTLELQDANKSLEEMNVLLTKAKNEIKKAGDGKKDFKGLETQIKKTEASMKKQNATAKKLGGTTKELNRNLKATKDTSADVGGVMGSMGGAAGRASGAFNQMRGGLKKVILGFKSLKFAIAATGIGLLVIGIIAVGKAFTSSEEGQNKFAKIMGVIGAITGNFVDILADLGEKIISVFENPQQAVKDFAELVKENITNRFDGLLELIPKLGEAITLLFSGKFSEAATVGADAVGKIVLGVEGVTAKIGESTEAMKKFIAEQVKEGNQAASVANMRAKADKLDRDLIVERSKRESEIAILRLKAKKEAEFTAVERREALLEAQKLEDQLLDKETAALILRRDAQKLENTFSRTDKENKEKEANAIAAVNLQVSKRANVARTLQRELNTIDGQVRSAEAKTELEKKKLAKEKADFIEKLRLAEIVSVSDKREEELRIEKDKYSKLITQAKDYYGEKSDTVVRLEAAEKLKLKELDDKFRKEDADKLLKDQEAKVALLSKKEETDELAFELRRESLAKKEAILMDDETLNDEQRLALKRQFEREGVQIEADAFAAKVENAQNRLQLGADILGSLSALTQSFAKEDEKSQKKAFELNKAFGIGQAIISTASGIMNAFANPVDVASGVAFVKSAAIGATGVAQIATISKTKFKGGASNIDKPAVPSLGSGDAGTQPRGFTSPNIDTTEQTTRVIVTETDIRDASGRVDGIYSRAVVVL